MTNEHAIQAAHDVLAAHIDALNARDEARLAATLHFPHVRLSGADLRIWDAPDTYFADFRARAGTAWLRSSFEDIQILRASNQKVHVDLQVNRYDASGQIITSFRSLWVITQDRGRWAAKLRSSFAST